MTLKDFASLLAAFVQDESPLTAAESGCFRVDRDWRLFRHVLRFLRDGILPSDPKLLRDLHVESEFWHFESLLKAIEAKNLDLWQLKQSDGGKAAAKDTGAKDREGKDPSAWWLDPPGWWGATIGSKTKEKAAKATLLSTFQKRRSSMSTKPKPKAKKSGEDDDNEMGTWWKDSKYKGTDYMDILAKDKPSAFSFELGANAGPDAAAALAVAHDAQPAGAVLLPTRRTAGQRRLDAFLSRAQTAIHVIKREQCDVV
ncbi:hypothetical protein PRIC1_010500 [Phytophthora ramorum]